MILESVLCFLFFVTFPCFSNDLVQIRGHKCCVLFCRLLSSFMSVGSLSNVSFSIYVRSLIPSNYLVALFLMFSKAKVCFILYWCHTALAQSRWDLTIVL